MRRRTSRPGPARSSTYDTLVLATGSYPFVPPVPNKDAEGCFVYRTIEDLLAIEEYAKTRTTGAVVGGGLLGLEAAGALKGLGLTSHIVEFAPRLMPVQVDEGGGAALLRTIEDMGLSRPHGRGHAGDRGRRGRRRHRYEAVRRFRTRHRPGGVQRRCPPPRPAGPRLRSDGRRARRHHGRRAVPYGRRPARLRDRRVRAGLRRPGVRPGGARLRAGGDGRRDHRLRRGRLRRRRPVDQAEAARRGRGVLRRRARHHRRTAWTSSTPTPARACTRSWSSAGTARCSAASWSATRTRTAR